MKQIHLNLSILMVSLTIVSFGVYYFPSSIAKAGTTLRVERVQIYFENRRAEITTERDAVALKAFAEIKYEGSGLFEGFWEIDGRLISNVKRHIPYGKRLTLVTPDIPPLPTVKTGTHRVRFVITRPEKEIPLPVGIYLVTEKRAVPEKVHVKLVSPPDGIDLTYEKLTFSWEGKEGNAIYLVEFFEDKGETPIFSAYSKKSRYRIHPAVLSTYFSPGKDYSWRVKIFNSEKNRTGVSPLFRFGFKKDH